MTETHDDDQGGPPPDVIGWHEGTGAAEPGLAARAQVERGAPSGRRRSLGIWVMVLVNFALAAAAIYFVRSLAGAETYLLNDSAEFGADLQVTQYGLIVLKLAGWILFAGFLLAGLGVLSLTRIGRLVQVLWALLLCLTIAGLVYGIPILVLLLTRGMRERFSRRPRPGTDG